jgi:class 3 adenylate cyclase
MIVRLHWTDEKGTPSSLDVGDRVFLGRTCRGVAEDRRIIVSDPRVSKDHAVVTKAGSQVTICDSSSNGTILNDVRMTPGVERVVNDGDTFVIGDRSFRLEIQGETRTFETLISTEKTTTISLEPVMTHLVADVRGYSTMSQRLSSTDVYEVMKSVFKELSKVVHRHQGVVKDFAGDAIFAVWEHGVEAKAEMAVAACLAAREQYRTLQRTLENLPEKYEEFRSIRMGWGITTGTVTLSHFGVQKGQLAVVGDSTNLAFRLSGLANKTLDSVIVLDSRTAELLAGKLAVRKLGGVDTKGREGKEDVYGLEVEEI